MNDGRDLHGWKRPARPAAVRCSACRRPFAAGYLPAPEPDGALVCRDCRTNHGHDDRG